MQTIYLEPDEEITSVIEKLTEADGSRVQFVVPRGAVLLQSIVNLKLLKKKAADLNREVSLVTTDKIGRNLASQVGLSVLQKVGEEPPEPAAETEAEESAPQAKPKIKAPRELEEIPELSGIKVNRYYHAEPADEQTEMSQPEPTEDVSIDAHKAEPEVRERSSVSTRPTRPLPISQPGRTGNNVLGKKIVLALFLLLLLGSAAAVLVFVPHATATVFVKGDPYVGNFAVTISTKTTSPNPDKAELDGHDLSSSAKVTKTEHATGSKDVGEKAKGTMTVYNGWSDQPQPLQSGTRFVSTDGKVFRSTTDVTVPGAMVSLSNGQAETHPSTATVAVEAENPGDSYNVPAGKFTIPGLSADQQAKIYGQTTAAMSGGVSKTVTIVSDADVAKVKKEAEDEATADLKTDLKQKAGQDTLLDEATELKVTETTVSAKSGDQTDSLTATTSADGRAISYSATELRELVRSLAQQKASSNQVVSIPEGTNPDVKIDKADLAGGQLDLKVLLSGKSYASIDTAKIQQALVNKSVDQAKEALAGQSADHIEVDLKPSWAKRLPWRAQQITVKVEPL